MEEQQINKTLAEWMGWKIMAGMEKESDPCYTIGFNICFTSKMKFTKNFDWFWPVWVKFRDMGISPDTSFTSKQWTKYDSFKDAVERGILSNNTPYAAAKLIASALVELKLLK